MKKIISTLCLACAFTLAQTPTQTVTITGNEKNAPQQRIIDPQNPQNNAPVGSVALTPENVSIALAQLANATNANLPQRLDFVTIFDRAVAKNKVMKYYYILNDDEDFVLSKFKKDRKDKFLNDIKTNVKNSLCASEMSRDLLNAGATFNYNFELRNGSKYFQFSMDKSVCK